MLSMWRARHADANTTQLCNVRTALDARSTDRRKIMWSNGESFFFFLMNGFSVFVFSVFYFVVSGSIVVVFIIIIIINNSRRIGGISFDSHKIIQTVYI